MNCHLRRTVLVLSLFFSSPSFAKEVVFTSVEPLALLIREICAETCSVESLVPKGVSEHDWQPGPKDLVKVKSSIASVAVGLGFDELWFKKLNLPPSKILWIGSKLSPLPWWSDDMVVGNRNIPPAKGKHQDEESHHGHKHHNLSDDPHVWVDAGRMATAVVLIAEHLGKQMPVEKALFLKRAGLVKDRLVQLQLSVEQRRSKWSIKPVVVLHDMVGYFARRFDLPVLAVSSGSSGHNLSAKMIAEVGKKFKDSHVAAIFVEKEDGAAKTLAKELKTSVKVLDFMATGSYKNWDEWYLQIVQGWDSVLNSSGG